MKRNKKDVERRNEIVEAHQLIYRGRKIREIMNSDAWKKFILPWLKSEEERLMKECVFDPLKGDQPDVQRLAFLNSRHSGSISMINSLQTEMMIWVNHGVEAEQKIKSQEKKNENIF